MTGPTPMDWRLPARFAGLAAALVLIALPLASRPAQAYWIGFGAPFPGFYGPGPYWGYAPPYYPPAPAYYPPPPPAYSAYAPTAPAAPTATVTGAPAAGAAAIPAITYTRKPAFTNAAGQTCREYQTTSGSQQVFGTACRQPDGQWRVTN
ncbi:MAG TPA: hypothetical protein VG651_07900 [Stellaceae bacterium]|nr:hypothetical protein [Stellaceae bacterium]